MRIRFAFAPFGPFCSWLMAVGAAFSLYCFIVCQAAADPAAWQHHGIYQSYDALDVHLNKPADEPELAEVLSAPFWARVFQRPFFGLDLRQTGSVLKLEDLISQ